MALTKEIFEKLATKGLTLKYGEALGKSYAFLLFGKFGLMGLTDVAEVVQKANDKQNANLSKELTEEMAADLAIDVFVEGMGVALKRAGVTLLEQFENPLIILSIVFKPEKLGNGELPPEIRAEIDKQLQANDEEPQPPVNNEQPQAQSGAGNSSAAKPKPIDNEHPKMDHDVHKDTMGNKAGGGDKSGGNADKGGGDKSGGKGDKGGGGDSGGKGDKGSGGKSGDKGDKGDKADKGGDGGISLSKP